MNDEVELSSVLSLMDVSKSYNNCVANRKINLNLYMGEIHGVLGEHASGKTSLANMLYGITQPDSGSILWKSHSVKITSPKKAQDYGIAFMSQEPQLYDSLSLVENIALTLNGYVKEKKLLKIYRKLSLQYGLVVDIKKPIDQCTIGEKKRIELIRCVLQNPKLIVLDNPSKYLSPKECKAMVWILRRLAEDGCSILYLTRSPREIMQTCHRVSVLSNGSIDFRCSVAETSEQQLENILSEDKPKIKSLPPVVNRKVVFRLQNITRKVGVDEPFKLETPRINFKSGEIVSIAGVMGNGQDQLFALLNGRMKSAQSVDLELNDEPIGHLNLMERQNKGLLFIHPDHKDSTSILADSLLTNTILSVNKQHKFSSFGILNPRHIKAYMEKIVGLYKIKIDSPQQTLGSLSNSGIHRFLFGRAVLQLPKVLIAYNPTDGVDLFTGRYFLNNLIALRNKGCCVIVLSNSIDEFYPLSDRIGIIQAGKLSPLVDTSTISKEEVTLMLEENSNRASTEV